MSHTVKIEIQVKDLDAWGAAVVAIGGELLGQGSHRLYETTEQGFGATFAWGNPAYERLCEAYGRGACLSPFVVLSDGSVAFDTDDKALVDAVTAKYAIYAARHAADSLGWYCEERNGVLVINHPDGGEILVKADGSVDASCFVGRDCSTATAPIEAALGRVIEASAKPEMYTARARVSVEKS